VKRRSLIGISVLVILVAVAVTVIVAGHQRVTPSRSYELTGASLEAFSSLEPIDAHTHVFQTSPALVSMLQRLHVHTLDILYVDDTNPYLKSLESQKTDARNFVALSQGHSQLCTTFDPFRIEQKNFSKSAVAELNQDFANGAVAVKVWKSVGMEIVNSHGQYLLPDDPSLEAIYQDNAMQGKTLMIHAGDPDAAWEGSSRKYYKENPQWDMSNKPGAPDKQTILKARDHFLMMNPNLRVVGAHFGSMEDHLDEVAAHLDQYQNFAVDTAARVSRLILQPRDKVQAFLLKYQDRILYGTDLNVYAGVSDPGIVESWKKQYARDWRYFATDDTFEYLGHTVQGLNLPRPVLKKLYHDNAVRWIPGVVGNSN
jgi:predicted TIM-barrel fold metal-dependent hydrolase